MWMRDLRNSRRPAKTMIDDLLWWTAALKTGTRDRILIGGQTGPASCANRRQSCEAPGRAQPATSPPRDAHGLGGRDLAARNGHQNGGQHLPEILDRAQRREVDPEMLAPGRWRRAAAARVARRGAATDEACGRADPTAPARPAAGPRDPARAAWDYGSRAAGPAGCRSFLCRTFREHRADEPAWDQDQAVEISSIPVPESRG